MTKLTRSAGVLAGAVVLAGSVLLAAAPGGAGGRAGGGRGAPAAAEAGPAPVPMDAARAAEVAGMWKTYKAPNVAGQEAVPGASVPNAKTPAGWQTIHNDFYWTDDRGQRIQTRSGCLCQFNGLYYWYGGVNGFRDQTCYVSSDLIHWVYKGIMLHQDFDANRIDVLYNDATKMYVMFLKYNGNGAHFGIATADNPEGPFTFKSQTLVDGALMGDMAMFKDTDGKAYLAYVSWAVGTNAQHGIYRLSDDYMTLEKRLYLWDIRSREAPHILKRNGIYYYGTSRTAGIQSSGTSYYTAKNLEGPWSPARPLPTPGPNNTAGSQNSWDSQVDFVYPIQGSKGTLYMFAGDRWTKDAPAGRNGDYIWLPMEWDGDVPTVHYYQDWDFNLAEGTWRHFESSRDLALGKKATASSEAGDNKAAKVTAAHTYQDYIGSHWDSEASDPQWLMVDLGSPMDINRVILKWNTGAGKDFKIQTSTDGTAWNDVFSTTLGSSYSVTDESFKTTSAQYLRMYGTARAAAPFGGRGGGRGGRAGGGAAQPATATAPATGAAIPVAAPAPGGAAGGGGRGAGRGGAAAPAGGYSVFDFEVLKD